MFVFYQLRNGVGVHPFQAFDAAGVVALQDAVEQEFGFLFAQCLGQHAADVCVGVEAERGLFGCVFGEFAEHAVDFFLRNIFQLGHCLADLLRFLGRQMFEHLGSFFLAQAEQQNGAVVDTGIAHDAPPAAQFLTTLATTCGSCLASWRALSSGLASARGLP